MPKVLFLPDNKVVDVRQNENLLRAAMAAEVHLVASCGGDGTCGKCRLIIDKGRVNHPATSKLSAGEVVQGYVLACLAEVQSDVEVTVPLESRPGRMVEREVPSHTYGHLMSSADFAQRLPAWTIDPAVRKTYLELPPPNLSDNMSDLERLRRSLRQEGVAGARMDLELLKRLPGVLRDSRWKVTATTVQEADGVEIVRVEAGDTTDRHLGVAVDLGTTTVVAELLDLGTGEVLARASEYNRQATRGEDVISRIIYATKKGGSGEDGAHSLQELAIQTIDSLLARLSEKADRGLADVTAMFVAGNTTMMHLLLGLTPKYIREEPYIPAATIMPWVHSGDLGLSRVDAHIYCFPNVASYVGGDITAGVLATGMHHSPKLTLYIDVGTNGEIVLGNSEWLMACSCSAGPAFEGGGVKHGMRAARGAIEQVRVDCATCEPMILTIGMTKPIGICGTGLIDTVAELLLARVIDQKGKFVTGLDTPRVREGDHGREYVLAWGSESASKADIVLTEVDIENLMRAKAAVFAGISTLLEAVEVDYSDIEEVLIAGAFGNYLEIEKVTTIGLLPELPFEKFKFVGNGSLLGAQLVGLSRDMMASARDVAKKMTYLELSVSSKFMDKYVSALFLPHTDMRLFPSVAEDLAQGR